MRAVWVLLLWSCLMTGLQAGSPPLTPPPAADGRLQVNVGMIMVDLRAIDDVAQNFEAVLIVYLTWQDPRLRADLTEVRTFSTDEIWNPRYQVTNEVFARKRFRDQLQVTPDGTVIYAQRLSGRFSSRLDLRKFPFDRQQLDFRLTFPDFEPQQLEVLPNMEFSGIMEELTIVDWAVGDWSIKSDPIFALKNISRASVDLAFEVKRRTGYYVWKIMFPLVLIVFMSWTVFWINPENAGAQVGIATSSILTLIAYRFILGNLLPRVSYMTRLDYFTLGATVLVFLALLEVVLTTSFAHAGAPERARRVDRGARLVFPLLFGLVVYTVFG